jgi:hypothetical protein
VWIPPGDTCETRARHERRGYGDRRYEDPGRDLPITCPDKGPRTELGTLSEIRLELGDKEGVRERGRPGGLPRLVDEAVSIQAASAPPSSSRPRGLAKVTARKQKRAPKVLAAT